MVLRVGTLKYRKGWSLLIDILVEKQFLLKVFRDAVRMITKLQYHCFYLHERHGSVTYLLYAERLMQEYLCVSLATIENLRLQFAKYNQDILRTEVLNNLQDAIASSECDGCLGKRIICPKSIYNSQRSRFCRLARNNSVQNSV